MNERLLIFLETSLLIWRRWWLLRWTISNMIGWSGGLLAAALLVTMGGLFGALLAGMLLGVLASAAQSLVLPLAIQRRIWVFAGAVSGLLVTLPVYGLALVALLHLSLGLALMGAAFGVAFGAGQALLLRQTWGERVVLWVIACGAAGMLCAPLTLSAATVGLPVFCAPGPLIFALVTGWALPRIADFSLIPSPSSDGE